MHQTFLKMISNRNILFISLALLFVSCSPPQLLDFVEYSKLNNIYIQRKFLSYVDSSNAIVIQSVVNEKESEEKNLCSFSENQLNSDGWGLILSGEQVQYVGSGTILANSRTSASYGRQLEPNSDTSMVLLSESTASTFNAAKRTLFLIDLHKKVIQTVTSFTPKVAYISQKVPFATMEHEYRYYDVQIEAKWINDTSFVLATDDGLFQYSTNNLLIKKILSTKTFFPGFFIYRNSIIAQNRTGITQIDLETGKSKIIAEESNIFKLQFSNGKLYFVNRWTLYCYDSDSESTSIVFKADESIKDFWLCPNNYTILRVGNLNDVKETNQFICLNLKNQYATEVDLSMSTLLDYYLSDDNRFFVIHKKTIQLKTYDILLVFDISKQKKIEFNYESLKIN